MIIDQWYIIFFPLRQHQKTLLAPKNKHEGSTTDINAKIGAIILRLLGRTCFYNGLC